VKKHENAARPFAGRRRRLEISEAAYGWHDPIVNVPPPRVESETYLATENTKTQRRTRFA